MSNFTFYKPNEMPDANFEIAVIAARHKDKWVFCRHKILLRKCTEFLSFTC